MSTKNYGNAVKRVVETGALKRLSDFFNRLQIGDGHNVLLQTPYSLRPYSLRNGTDMPLSTAGRFHNSSYHRLTLGNSSKST